MTKEIITNITIPAQPSDVWDTLMEFASYEDWNPFIQCIVGQCEVGAPLRITLRKPSGKLYTFMATVTACVPSRLLQWEGSLAGMPWLFSGVHSFELKAVPGGATEFVHKERFSGVLSSLVLAGIHNDTTRGFDLMNLALSDKVLATRRGAGELRHA
jgi:hypothetical protein